MPTDKILKGRITEAIFEEMFKNAEGYRVLHYGYEYTLPELTLAEKDFADPTFKMISKSPDFLLHNLNTRRAHLIEVKYISEMKDKDVLKIADELNKKGWSLAWLFIASKEGFFFDDVKDILKNDGKIKSLSTTIIQKPIQDEYHEHLRQLLKV